MKFFLFFLLIFNLKAQENLSCTQSLFNPYGFLKPEIESQFKKSLKFSSLLFVKEIFENKSKTLNLLAIANVINKGFKVIPYDSKIVKSWLSFLETKEKIENLLEVKFKIEEFSKYINKLDENFRDNKSPSYSFCHFKNGKIKIHGLVPDHSLMKKRSIFSLGQKIRELRYEALNQKN